jgi:hypothetical protein
MTSISVQRVSMSRQRFLRHPTRLFEISAGKTTDQLISEIKRTDKDQAASGQGTQIL